MDAPVAELTKEPDDKSGVLISDISNCGWIGRRSIASAEGPAGSGFRPSVLETESSLMCLVRTQRVNTLRPEAEDERRGGVVSGPRSQGPEGVLGLGLSVLKSGESCMNSDRVVTLGSNQVAPARVDHARNLGCPFWAVGEHGCVSSRKTLKAILHAD